MGQGHNAIAGQAEPGPAGCDPDAMQRRRHQSQVGC